MIKSRVFRWLAVLAAVATGLTIAAAAASIGPFRDRPHVATPPPPGPQQPTPLSDINPSAAQDEAKGFYAGPLGDFLITPGQDAAFPPCPEPLRPARNYKDSELYSPVFGDKLEVSECADGKIVSISAYGTAAIGKRYFVGPPKTPYQAPLDRLVLLDVAGKPAIAQLPKPGDPGSLRFSAIERSPSGNQPGVLVWIDNTHMNLKEAAALAAEIMGVRP